MLFRSDEEGYYDTKDIVSEKNGYFKILGRETDLVNIGGIKINPHELESYLLTNENIKEALAYGVKNNILGQTINLDIQLVKKDSITKTKACNELLGKISKPNRNFFSVIPSHQILYKSFGPQAFSNTFKLRSKS